MKKHFQSTLFSTAFILFFVLIAILFIMKLKRFKKYSILLLITFLFYHNRKMPITGLYIMSQK